MILHADCLEAMAQMPAASVDAIVTDPPYGLEFMGKEWDKPSRWRNESAADRAWIEAEGNTLASRRRSAPVYGIPKADMQEWHQRWATEALRVAKPGAYLLAFGGTRTYHRLACAIEDAGWIIRDCLVWAYASGFPKSRALLKPAWEPIVMARKPGPLRELAIDACRIGTEPTTTRIAGGKGFGANFRDDNWQPPAQSSDSENAGRWPANVVLTDAIFDGGIAGVVGGGEAGGGYGVRGGDRASEYGFGADGVVSYGDSGTYSRFFLIPKADRAEREPVFGGLAESNPYDRGGPSRNFEAMGSRSTARRNHHPTVKPLDLMRHLVRLVTPQGGTVLDPFAGSGTTLIAAEMEGFAWIGVEREADYVAIIEARLQGVQRGLGLYDAV